MSFRKEHIVLLLFMVVIPLGSAVVCECKKNTMGMGYNGHRSTTISGYTCQRWDSQTPHSHNKNDVTKFPNAVNNEENYCRNPDGRGQGPWCFTTDPDMKNEFCDIPLCSGENADCKDSVIGLDYNGSISWTEDGEICQRWDSQTPHPHNKNDVTKFPNAVNNKDNYCRNPDERGNGPWCFTINPDVKNGFCDISICTTRHECRRNQLGKDYNGTLSTTVSGHTCQSWDSQTPHSHTRNNVTLYPNAVNNEENFCRNPDEREKGPWCYTTDPDVEKEFCNVPYCSFRFAQSYGNSMVLQRSPARAIVWGYTQCEGAVVEVTMGDDTYQATSYIGPAGLPVWRVELLPQAAGGPHTIEAAAEGNTITLDDVMFGDVYICAGQSNMAMPMSQIDDPDSDITDSVNYPNVRTFRSSNVYSKKPLDDVSAGGIAQVWQRPDGGSDISKFSAVCWLFGRNLNAALEVPIGLIQSTWRATRIEAWTSSEGLEICWPGGSVAPGNGKNEASVLWNAMIHPFLNTVIYGAVWYQGEGNKDNADEYACAIKAMVGDWRSQWHSTTGQTESLFPFGQVQLATSSSSSFADVRWAQTYNAGYTPNDDLINVYTAVAVDLPDPDSPEGATHPRYKRPIAERLLLGALQVGYGNTSQGQYQGPIPTSVTVGPAAIEVEYDNGAAVLEQRATVGFEVCCASNPSDRCPDAGTWTNTVVVGTAGSTVDLDNPCVSPDVATGMRYLWSGTPCVLELCPIYRVENELPAPPYTMDL